MGECPHCVWVWTGCVRDVVIVVDVVAVQLNILQSFTVFVDMNHEYVTIWCEAFATHSPTFFVVRRSERSAFLLREFTRVNNGSWWA
jgi:hypothetical protein